MPTITKVYESHWRARNAVSDLEAAGIPSSKISILANKNSADDVNEASATATGAGVGAVVGAEQASSPVLASWQFPDSGQLLLPGG